MGLETLASSVCDHRVHNFLQQSPNRTDQTRDRQISNLEREISKLWTKINNVDPNDHKKIDQLSCKAMGKMIFLSQLKAKALNQMPGNSALDLTASVQKEKESFELAEAVFAGIIGRKPLAASGNNQAPLDTLAARIAEVKATLDQVQTEDQEQILEQLVLLEHSRHELLCSQAATREEIEKSHCDLDIYRSRLVQMRSENGVNHWKKERPNDASRDLNPYSVEELSGALKNCSDRLKAVNALQTEVRTSKKVLENWKDVVEGRRSPNQNQQDPFKNYLAPVTERFKAIAEHEKELDNYVIELKQFYKECSIEISRKEMKADLEADTSRGYVGKAISLLGKALSEGIDQLIGHFGGGQNVHKLSSKSWGRLLFEEDAGKFYLFQRFEGAVHYQKTSIHKAEARLTALQEQIEHLEKNPLPGPQGLEKTDRMIKSLQSQLETTTLELTELRISLHGTVLNRLIDVLTDRRREKTKVEAQISQLEHRARQNPAWEEPLREARSKLRRLDEEIQAIGEGYDSHIKKYKEHPKPPKTMGRLLAGFTLETAKEVLAMGYLSNTYVTPAQFAYRKQLADKGYLAADALNLLQSKPGEPLKEMVVRTCQEFVVWAKDHPDEADTVFINVAVSVSMFVDEDNAEPLMDMLTDAYKVIQKAKKDKKGELAPRDLTHDDLKFQALADLSKYVPLGLSLQRGGQEAWNAWKKDGIPSALLTGLKSLVLGQSQSVLMRRLMQEFSLSISVLNP